jgi:SAM-dependent methyltransferase
MHLAISPGRFRPEGFTGQLERISAAWPADPPRDVLEIGFGQGFNLAWLAPRFPGVRFSAIDLTPSHLALARGRLDQLGVKNAVLTGGDFHALPYPDASFDHVYAVEAFCYARDLRQALSEVARVLRPGGSFRLFDGYLARRPRRSRPRKRSPPSCSPRAWRSTPSRSSTTSSTPRARRASNRSRSCRSTPRSRPT